MKDERMNSGDVGYCIFRQSIIGVIITWRDGVVVDLDCDYRSCCDTLFCKLYKAHPIGFSRSPEASRESQNPSTFG